MTTMNISLPDALKSFVEEQVAEGSFGTGSEYIRSLIRKDQARQRLRALLIEGLESPGAPMPDGYFDQLRARIAASGK